MPDHLVPPSDHTADSRASANETQPGEDRSGGESLDQRTRLQRCLASPYALLALLALTCHGLLLLCDYKIWDGWLIENWQETRRYDSMWRMFSEAGAPQQFFVHRFIGFFIHNPWFYKLASLLAYYGSVCGCYFVTVRTALLTRQSAFITAAFMATCPGLMTLGDSALFPYVLATFAFFAAAGVAIQAEFASGIRHGVLRVLAIALFFIGMTYYAMVVFYLGFYLLYVWFIRRQHSAGTAKDMAILILKRSDYLVLPLVFWFLRLQFAPTHGFYVGYNKPQLDPGILLEAYRSLFVVFLPGHFRNLIVDPLTVTVIVLGSIMLTRRWRIEPPKTWQSVVLAIGAGCFLVFLGCFPYAAVKRVFNASGWTSNASQLIPIGAGFILAALIGAIRKLFTSDRSGIVAMLAFSYLLVSFSRIWSRNYLCWQALAAKERSVKMKLTRADGARDISVFQILDRFRIPNTAIYPPAVWTVQIQEAFDDRSKFAVDIKTPRRTNDGVALPMEASEIEQLVAKTTLPYYFNEVNAKGRQAFIVIEPGKHATTPAMIAWRAIGLRLFPSGRQAQYAAFMNGLTDVAIFPAH